MKTVSILGATGSIGQSTAKVIAAHADRYDVQVVTANGNADKLAEMAKALNAKCAIVSDKSVYNILKDNLAGTGIKVAAGRSAILEAAAQPVDYTMSAITGMAGLEPLLEAIERGGHIAIANKEPLVAAGSLVMDAAKKSGATILPVDSEHNAIFQVFEAANKSQIRKLILTASGGPFRTWSRQQMEKASVEQALDHPNWSMGDKITIDSATMMNKALEIIEAHILFGMPADQIGVLIHPQSIVHSMVEYADGSVLAQMGAPDMCTPIAHTLAWPDRIETPGNTLNWQEITNLAFEQPDYDRFPALKLAYDAIQKGQGVCLAFNAANEVAVEAFLKGRIGFADIVRLVKQALENFQSSPLNGLDEILECDTEVRRDTENAILTIEQKTEAA